MANWYKPAEHRTPVLNGRRSEPRARVAIAGTLEAFEGPQPALVLNLSCLGAMVQTGYSAECESAITLRCGPVDTVGTVVWQQDDRLGLAFDDPIHEELILELRRRAYHQSQSARTMGRGRGVAARPLTADEAQAAEDWATYSARTKPAIKEAM